MKQDNYRYKSSEIPFFAHRIPGNYNLDKSYSEQHPTKFNHELLASFAEEVKSLIYHTSSQPLKDEIIHSNDKIVSLLANFSLMLNIMETFLHSNYPAAGIRPHNFIMKEVKDALSKGSIWETQRNCENLIYLLENNLDEFIDKGFISILISDLHILVRKLNELLNTIIESEPSDSSDDASAKPDEYSIEKLMIQSLFRSNEVH